jgi:hypothetical protein
MPAGHRCATLTRVAAAEQVEAGGSRFTARLRLEPVGPTNARDLWLVHNDELVSRWYDHDRPSLEEAERRAARMAESWRRHGVHKWIAYHR